MPFPNFPIEPLQLIHWARTHDHLPAYVILSTDTEKVFDCIDWDFLNAVLVRLALGPHMLLWILALFMSPTAQVRVDGCLPPLIPILNGTRQGCLLSPLLFALV